MPSIDLSSVAQAYFDAERTDGIPPAMDALKLAATANANELPGTPVLDLGPTTQAEGEASVHHPCIGAEDLVPPTDRRIS